MKKFLILGFIMAGFLGVHFYSSTAHADDEETGTWSQGDDPAPTPVGDLGLNPCYPKDCSDGNGGIEGPVFIGEPPLPKPTPSQDPDKPNPPINEDKPSVKSDVPEIIPSHPSAVFEGSGCSLAGSGVSSLKDFSWIFALVNFGGLRLLVRRGLKK